MLPLFEPGLDKPAEIEERNSSTAVAASLKHTQKSREITGTYVEHCFVIFIRYYADLPM
jgi:hypothetical protein